MEFDNGEEQLCKECDTLIEEALALIDKDPSISKYFESVQIQQGKASVRLEKLKYLYHNDQTEGRSKKFFKNTGKGIVKLYRFNVLDTGISAMKKIFKQPNKVEEGPTEEELLVEEILELESFISTDPIEFVIYKYLIPEEEKEAENPDTDTNKGKKDRIFIEPIKYFTTEKISKLSPEKQVNVAITIVIVVGLLTLLILFL